MNKIKFKNASVRLKAISQCWHEIVIKEEKNSMTD
jgi:hypothetical protein